MCFNAVSATRKLLKYAKDRVKNAEMIKKLEKKLRELENIPDAKYVANGYAHPKLLVFPDAAPYKPHAFRWGLIPSWVKDEATAKQIMNKTINARGESIFEKPSFRNAANNKRCLIYLDAFYEYHHFNNKTFPFHISMSDDSTMPIGGLWEEWINKETGEIINSVSIITTPANELMTKIHNNPKLKESRMPLIIPKALQDDWLKPINNEQDKKDIKEMIRPIDSSELKAHTVRKLSGKDSVGNTPEAEEKYVYEELKND